MPAIFWETGTKTSLRVIFEDLLKLGKAVFWYHERKSIILLQNDDIKFYPELILVWLIFIFNIPGRTLRASLHELTMVLVMVGISIIIFSSSIYYAEYSGDNNAHYGDKESHNDGDKNKLSSIPDAFWYTIATMTTVGYGDFVPVTFIGKLVGLHIFYRQLDFRSEPVANEILENGPKNCLAVA